MGERTGKGKGGREGGETPHSRVMRKAEADVRGVATLSGRAGQLEASRAIFEPIIPQFYPSRAWLWQRWWGTILQRVLPNEVFWNSVFAALFVWVFGRIAATAEAAQQRVEQKLAEATAQTGEATEIRTAAMKALHEHVMASNLSSGRAQDAARAAASSCCRFKIAADQDDKKEVHNSIEVNMPCTTWC